MHKPSFLKASSIERIPTLETERTYIRPFNIEDAFDLFALDSQEVVMNNVSWPAKNVKESIEYITSGPLIQYVKDGFGRMCIIDKKNQKMIGVTGLKYLTELNEVDIAYRLLPEYWGQGIATEVANRVIDFGLNEIGIPKIIGMAFPHNSASINILKKIGMEYERNVLFWAKECVLYAIQKGAQ